MVSPALNHGFVIQRVSQTGDNLNVLVITSGDADDQTRDFIFFTEAHAFRVLAEDDAGFQHAVLRFDGAVRYRNGLAEIGRGQFSRSSIACTYSGST